MEKWCKIICIVYMILHTTNGKVTPEQLQDKINECKASKISPENLSPEKLPQGKAELKPFCKTFLHIEKCMGDINDQILKGEYEYNGTGTHPTRAFSEAVLMDVVGKMCRNHLSEVEKYYDCVLEFDRKLREDIREFSCEKMVSRAETNPDCKKVLNAFNCILDKVDAACPGVKSAFEKIAPDVTPEIRKLCEKLMATSS